MKSMIKVFIQAELVTLLAILLLKLMEWINPQLQESINLWWALLIPAIAFLIALPINYFSRDK